MVVFACFKLSFPSEILTNLRKRSITNEYGVYSMGNNIYNLFTWLVFKELKPHWYESTPPQTLATAKQEMKQNFKRKLFS